MFTATQYLPCVWYLSCPYTWNGKHHSKFNYCCWEGVHDQFLMASCSDYGERNLVLNNPLKGAKASNLSQQRVLKM